MAVSKAAHWEAVYAGLPATAMSWYQPVPATSLRLVRTWTRASDAVVDVGGGASSLVDELLEVGYRDVTVVDVAGGALQLARGRLEARAALVTWVVTDVLAWSPGRQFDVWHDRAVFHFLVDPEEQSRYVMVAAAAVRTGGHLVLGTFASDGPPQCSGLPVAHHEAASLAELFAPAFTLASAEREVHRSPANVKQPFTWVALRRIG